MTVKEIVKKASAFTGYELTISRDKYGTINLRDHGRKYTALGLAEDGREIYGRIRDLGLTEKEVEVLLSFKRSHMRFGFLEEEETWIRDFPDGDTDGC